MPKPVAIYGILSRGILALLLLVAGLALTACFSQPIDAALSLTADGYADTDFDLKHIDGSPHSWSFRVMYQYPNSFENTVLGESGSDTFFIGKLATPGFVGDTPRMAVRYGNVLGVYSNIQDLADSFAADTWYHIAVTVDPDLLVSLYVNGVKAIPLNGIDIVLEPGPWASGFLRFGQRNSSATYPWQQYGFVDDVMVWDRALTKDEVKLLADEGEVGDYIERWTFDVFPNNYDGRMDPPLDFHGKAGKAWPLSNAFDWPDLYQKPGHATALRLPFGGEWLTGQAFDAGPFGSHRGRASFAIDWSSANEQVQPTRGADVLAAADGKVVYVRETSPDSQPNQQVSGCTPCEEGEAQPAGALRSCAYQSNVVIVEHNPNEYTEYVHLQPNSVPVAVGQNVAAGQKLGTVGRSGTGSDHLHFAMLWRFVPQTDADPNPMPGQDTPTSSCGYYPAVRTYGVLTRPFAFSEYEVKAGGAGPFKIATNRIPLSGDILRPPQ